MNGRLRNRAGLKGFVSPSSSSSNGRRPDSYMEPGSCQAGDVQRCHFERAVLQRVQNYIHERLAESLYVEELSRFLGLGERSLHVLFQNEFGVPPMQYVRQQRLLLARRMLETQSHLGSVKAAALSVGFRDMGRFALYYREAFGERPSETLGRFTSTPR